MIDAEINTEFESNETSQKMKKHVLSKFCNKFVEKKKNEEEYNKSFEKYKKCYPDDKHIFCGWILE